MKASELNADHIGKWVKIETKDGVVLNDILTAVHHEADMIDDRTVFSAGPVWLLGRMYTELTFMTLKEVGFSPSIEVQVIE